MGMTPSRPTRSMLRFTTRPRFEIKSPGLITLVGPGRLVDVSAFVVENQKGEVTSFTTDGQGRFRMPLAPGHYRVSLKGKTRGVGRFGPFEADVVAGQITKVQWQCDSGLR